MEMPLSAALMVIALTAGSCAESPETAGNSTVQFLTDLQDEDYDAAYRNLCGRLRSQYTAEEFAARGGGEFGDAVRRGAFLLESTQYPDVETQEEDVLGAWTEVEGSFEGRMLVWRVDLVKEDGDWHVCDINLRR